MIVVVGGQWRNVGKTRAVCDIIAATREASWVAVKVSSHTHHRGSSTNKDTDRYKAAGALEAHLIQGRPPVALPEGANLIIESNAILDQVQPDLFFFVTDPSCPDWKASARRQVGRPDTILVQGVVTGEQIQMVRAKISERRA